MGIRIANDSWAELAAGTPVWLWPIVAAVAISVVSTVLVPWLTVQRTKAVERRDKERADRREAAAALLKAACDMYLELERQSEKQTSGKVYSLDLQQAAARVLVLSSAGRDEASAYFADMPLRILRGDGNFTLPLAGVLGDWIPEGRFAVSRLPKSIKPLTPEET